MSFNLQEMNSRLNVARSNYLGESKKDSAEWMLNAVRYLDSVKPLDKGDYDEDGSIKDSAPDTGVSKDLATKASAVSKILTQAYTLRKEIEEKNKALDKLDRSVRTHAKVKKEIGGSKSNKYHEKNRRNGVYQIFDGLDFGGITSLHGIFSANPFYQNKY